MDWYTCSKTFINVVDCKSFSQASRTMYTTHSSISKRIAWLENQLDTQLLIRSTRRLELTEAGEKYYNKIVHLIDEWEETKKRLAEQQK
ncbi:LysR family transcriptional regulator [Legionella tunisiensis]|uniref:LysR family transcriptional regulator n=1 Tax=Legionella tunisiensis TaxID=1034944 RepID=UPI00036386E4